MKNLSILAFVLIICACSSAQKKVGGFYKGTLFNDSTKMVQQYELALAEYRGKIMGYSYVTFVANDTFYYGIRKINAKIVGDSLVVEDDKMIANNFPEAPAKHVNRTVTIPFNGQDSLVSINGRWKTNKTKIYYAVPGSVEASKSGDSSGSALFAHLKELNLMPNESNYVATTTETKSKEKGNQNAGKAGNNPGLVQSKPQVQEDQATTVAINTNTGYKPLDAKSNQDKSKTQDNTVLVQTKSEAKEDPVAAAALNTNNKSQETKSRKNERNTKANKADSSALVQTRSEVKEDNAVTIAANNNTNDKSRETKPGQERETNPEAGNNSAVVQTKTGVKEGQATTVAVNTDAGDKSLETNGRSEKENRKSDTQPATVAVTHASKSQSPAALNYTQRKNHLQQTVEISADSLVLSFYDNGVVDGDSISVYMNDQLVIGSTKLKSVATKKTVYVSGMSEIKLVLVADNMGTLPPNTGLMMIRDGDKTYQVNFTADMQTNASIILRRKRN